MISDWWHTLTEPPVLYDIGTLSHPLLVWAWTSQEKMRWALFIEKRYPSKRRFD